MKGGVDELGTLSLAQPSVFTGSNGALHSVAMGFDGVACSQGL